MLTKTLFYLSYFFGLLCILFSILTVSRAQLPYNEAGRYYDAKDSIVYHEQAMELYGVIAVVSLLITFLLLTIAFIRSR